MAWSTGSAAASTRYGRTGSCRPSRSRASPTKFALGTLWFEDLGDGRTRLRTQLLCDSFEGRDAWLRSGMETGVDEGYAKLDRMLADDAVLTARPNGTGRWPAFLPNESAVPGPGTRHPRSPAGPPATWFVT